jgi:PAS domain S-box-containing protein
VNDRGAALLGAARREDLIGRPLVDYLHPDDREQSRQRNRRILAGEPVEPVVDGRIVRPDGTVIHVERSVSACTYHGRPALQSVLHDITERKAGEEALLVAQEEAELASRAKTEFLANMSHELRTPLNAVIGFAELIEREQLGPIGNPKYAEYASDIVSSGLHLLSLINDILDLSKIEAGHVDIRDENIDMADLVRACLKLMGDRAREGGVDLIVQVDDGLPLLRADQRMVKQVLVNLLSNAVKFTPPGGRVTVRAWQNPQDGYVLQVADTGIGIAFEDVPKAMARFGQIDSDVSRRFEGTGLGLPLTRSLIEAHGGAFDLESEVGAGTTATAHFPAQRIVSAPGPASRSPAA